VTGWDVFTSRASVPAGVLADLAALRAALPAYDVVLTSHSPVYRFEAIRRRTDDPSPWCVISSDPADLWQELAGRPRPAALDGDQAGHALLLAALTIGSDPADRIPRLTARRPGPPPSEPPGPRVLP
jgi:hypothetical protein